MKLTDHFSLAELTASDWATRHNIANTPSAAEMANLRILAGKLEHARAVLGGHPVFVTSGYRNTRVNAGVGGAKNSSHMSGLAADIKVAGYDSALAVCRVLAAFAAELDFDQLIYEGTWTHIGFAGPGARARREVLTARFGGGGTTYSVGLP
jgi:hypothetical protein